MNLKSISAVLLLSVSILSADELTDGLKSINQQIIEHNDRLDAMVEKLRAIFADRIGISTNQDWTRFQRTYANSTNSIYWITNNFETEWKSASSVKRDRVKEMELDGSLTNVINLLITSGKFCAIRGHAWGTHMHVTLEYEPGRIGCRQCQICGLHQSQHTTDWK